LLRGCLEALTKASLTKFNHFEGLNSQTGETKGLLKLVTSLEHFSRGGVAKSCFSPLSLFTAIGKRLKGEGGKKSGLQYSLNLILVRVSK
jgi:hypothetical protein